MPTLQATYLRAAHTFRAVLDRVGAADLVRPVPSCPGWTVSDVVTHVLEHHEHVLGAHLAGDVTGDLMATYAAAIPDDPALAATAPYDTLELTLHAWDVARALEADLRLGEDQLTFLEVLAREAGDTLYAEEGFARLEGDAADPAGLDRQGLALLPFGRREDATA
ncbi:MULTISPECIES: maleylpyruvate isomerase N-terminal domain-containing protein [Nocardioides]|uniref:Maleylpyruvate isomerase N-terminal domain-containing protein n=1 Tax=Nocardioides kribbensis TaxID=305517 RepID=A0ABV1P3N2_9ACTN|nr:MULTISPECIES: maleylpyruvate isomerase N-terminal domain-containing protein [Nocardioides]MCM3513659.1 maleylpyruvate isomerase N-terminal domain-containing protein [Nocardioides sp. P86]